MSEIIDFKKLDQSFPYENLEATKIFSSLEHLPTNTEFDDFIKENLVAKSQRVNIPNLSVRRSDMSEELRGLDLLPNNFRMRKIRIALLQDEIEDDWQLSTNFEIDDDKYHCLGDQLGLVVAASSKKESMTEVYDTKIGHHLVHMVLSAAGFDTEKFKIADWEKLYIAPEISDHIIDLLATDYKSETIKNTALKICPNGYGLVASQTAKVTKYSTSADISLNVLRQLTPEGNENPKTLIYEFKNSIDDGTSSLLASRVTWQILRGEAFDLGNNLEIAKIEQSDSPTEELTPIKNFEAWKKFMQIADEVLCYSMRGA